MQPTRDCEIPKQADFVRAITSRPSPLYGLDEIAKTFFDTIVEPALRHRLEDTEPTVRAICVYGLPGTGLRTLLMRACDYGQIRFRDLKETASHIPYTVYCASANGQRWPDRLNAERSAAVEVLNDLDEVDRRVNGGQWTLEKAREEGSPSWVVLLTEDSPASLPPRLRDDPSVVHVYARVADARELIAELPTGDGDREPLVHRFIEAARWYPTRDVVRFLSRHDTLRAVDDALIAWSDPLTAISRVRLYWHCWPRQKVQRLDEAMRELGVYKGTPEFDVTAKALSVAPCPRPSGDLFSDLATLTVASSIAGVSAKRLRAEEDEPPAKRARPSQISISPAPCD